MNMHQAPPLRSPSTRWFHDVEAGRSQRVNTCARLDLLLHGPSAKQPLLLHPVFKVRSQTAQRDLWEGRRHQVWTWSLGHFG
ncbi:hypothetical protein CesoFtcFv8_013484 [Champsocephalus esox]|uniref:Uncharacterized protein n=1 Tax=Champsocephalus esox TaxID=159716 RepID=A0AAN8GS26_9TELE|nr:hypothetical protein CesoFtcFv8_013484 [Champsocephalus esox]